MADQVTSEAEPVSPIEQGTESDRQPDMNDLFSMDLDEMKVKIDVAEHLSDQAAPEPTEETEVPSESGEVADTVADPESVDEPEIAAQSEETPENGESEVTEADELRAMLDLQQSESKRLESLLGNRAGEDGFFKRKAADLEGEIARLRQQPQDVGYDPVQPAPQPAQPRQNHQNEAYMLQLAMKDASQEFLQGTPEIMVDQDGQSVLDPAFNEAMQPHMDKIKEALATGDVIHAKSEVTRLLNSAWNRVDRDRKVANLDEIKRKRADQAKRLTDKKRASAAASPSTTPATPATKRIDPRNMTTEKLKELAEAENRKAGLL